MKIELGKKLFATLAIGTILCHGSYQLGKKIGKIIGKEEGTTHFVSTNQTVYIPKENYESDKMICLKKDSKLYNNNNKEERESIKDISYLETASVYGELDDSYLVAYDDKLGFVSKEDAEELDTCVVVDLSDNAAYIYQAGDLISTANIITEEAHKNEVKDENTEIHRLIVPEEEGIYKVKDRVGGVSINKDEYRFYADESIILDNDKELHFNVYFDLDENYDLVTDADKPTECKANEALKLVYKRMTEGSKVLIRK